MADIDALRRFAKRSQNKQWYLSFCETFDANPKTAYVYFKRHPELLETIGPMTGYYKGKSGPCLTVSTMWVLRNPAIENACVVCGAKTSLLFRGGYAETCSVKCGAKICVSKRQATCLAKYGSTNPSRVESIKAKRLATFRERFACDNPFQAASVKAKIVKSMQDKYGVRNPSQSEKVKERKRATFVRNYGQDHWTKNKEIYKKSGLAFNAETVAKSRATYLKKTGYQNPLLNPEVQERARTSCVARLGVDNPFKSREIRQQIEQTWLDKYGVVNPWKAESIKQKIMETNEERYGVAHPQVRPGIRHQLKKITDRFGVTHTVEGYEHEVIGLFSEYRNVRRIVSSRELVPSLVYKHKGKERRYYPDLVVYTTTQKILVEVKSAYTLMLGLRVNLAKFREAVKRCRAVGAEFLLVVGKNDEGRFLCVKNPTTKKDLVAAGLRFKGNECRFRR